MTKSALEPRSLRVGPTLLVALKDNDFSVPLPSGLSLRIGLPELLLLEGLASRSSVAIDDAVAVAASRTGGSREDLHSFVQQLERLGHLVGNAGAGNLFSRIEEARADSESAEFVFPHDRIVVATPLSARLNGSRFELIDHRGARPPIHLAAVEFFALGALTEPLGPESVYEAHRSAAGVLALGEREFGQLLARLRAAGILAVLPEDLLDVSQTFGESGSHASSVKERDRRLRTVFTRRADEQDVAERAREALTGRKRTKVVPVAFDAYPPLGLGLIVANAKAHKGGMLEDFYDFRLEWDWDENRLALNTAQPSVFLFSNYLWSHAQCMQISEKVKERSPASITVHGGPDTPKYEQDVEEYFRANPSVDVTVRGEGEATAAEVLAALQGIVGDARPDLSLLANVRGISFRDGDRVVRTPDRERISDVDQIPSPFLTGLFDAYAEVPGSTSVVTETNRGCPYGCTFCDWGSATLSRIRKFSMERVLAEIDWCAEHGIFCIGPADANFGIFERDVEIAEKIAAVKRVYGFPKAFGVSYAKNSVKHLKRIIQTLAEAGIVTQGILSLQTMDTDTLDVVHRSNIKTEKYDQLAGEFRRAGLPLFVDLMLGLPGSTTASFRADLQQCINREVQVRIPRTTLLVNSPMNDPAYRAEHRIETNHSLQPGVPRLVISTATFTREEYEEMTRLRLMFLLFENFGVLRQVSRFVRQENGIDEVELYERIRVDAESDRARWPMLYVVSSLVPTLMSAPASWKLFIDELRQYLVNVIGVAATDALETVLTVQHALLPAHGRSMPESLQLPHDYAAWYSAMIEVKESTDRDDWTSLVPRLADLPPGEFRIDDPGELVRRSIGCDIEMHGFGVNWEFQSPVCRAFVASERDREAKLTVGSEAPRPPGPGAAENIGSLDL